MNLMRKLRAGAGGSSTSTQDESNQNSKHTALGLMHLKKLFSEFSHPTHPLSDREKDDKLYNMLPLFCKVFANSPPSDMLEKFKDVLALCQYVSKLMVSEIRRRASNQSTEMASCAIAKFLEIENSEESSNGWMLLSTLNLLAAGDVSLIQVMTSASVPSTLVKCLYLFFDLPENDDSNSVEPGSELTARERRIQLHKMFVQILVRLCHHNQPAEELARKDDLALLFSAITSCCPAYNVIWRKSAAEVLMTLSRHGLSQPVVSYIHNKGCVALCIDNMQRAPMELSPIEIVEMIVTVFCFLKDSSEVSQTLLDDFKSCQGYVFLSEFLLRMEHDPAVESQDAIRNLVLLIASLAMCGYVELKPSQASIGSLFHMIGFTLPQPLGRGSSVRNIQAFQVLQSVFLKSNSTNLCSTILDAISSVYHADNANYFILEGQNTLSEFAEKIHTKPQEIQAKFFELLEFIVFQLNFVPCKELISLSILLRDQNSIYCSITCTGTLLSILKHNAVFKDVYREVGLLEVFVSCLQKYENILKEKMQAINEEREFQIGEYDTLLGNLIMDALGILLSANVNNAAVLRECGGARCVHNLVLYPQVRQQALGIIRELVLSTGGESDMGTLLGMMNSAAPTALELKSQILKSLLLCLRESHRSRTVFRKLGGFVYVMNVLVSMESSLSSKEPAEPWNKISNQEVFALLHMVFNTVTVAMRFEPANAKAFQHEICYTSLCDTVRLLGCFSNQQTIEEVDESLHPKEENTFYQIFSSPVSEVPKLPNNVPAELSYACVIFRMLYDVALDCYDKPNSSIGLTLMSPSHRRQTERMSDSNTSKRSMVASLNLSPPAPDPMVVHAGVVVAMLHLIPSIQHEKAQIALAMQVLAAEVLKSLVRSERNQQVMCEAGLPGEILKCGRVALEEETHPLHPALQYMLERLAAQTLEPRDLREFLRLGDPLCTVAIDEYEAVMRLRPPHKKPGGPVPLTRVKTLVSMTTPRDFHLHGTSVIPPFVEFDMSAEGFGCMFLPSIAPQCSSDTGVIGGIGAGDRFFPPQTGLSFSTWICVDKYSDPRTDPHCVRLLTVVRQAFNREEPLACLTFVLSARDKAIIASTQETTVTTGEWEPEVVGDSGVRVWCPDLLQEGQWHHLVLVLYRAALKNSVLFLYVDGQLVHTQKMHYIAPYPGGSANLTLACPVYAYIGTPPLWRRNSRLTWKQGPCHLIEEVLSQQIVTGLYQLGPQYMGSLQAPEMNSEPLSALVAEEKIVFGLNSKAVTQLTLAKIRKVYSRSDNRYIAKQLGMSSHENATPIRVLHNSSGHLAGPARTLGGVVIGYLGVRVFSPRPVAKMVENVGGSSVMLGLIAMACDVESLYAAVKALVCVVKSSQASQHEMDRQRGYQTLASLLRRNKSLLNSHILHLAFSLVGTVDSGRESSSIPNVRAFNDLLCDLEIWYEAPGDLIKSLFEHLLELVTESSERRANLRIVRDLHLVPKILRLLLTTPCIHSSYHQVLTSLLGALLAGAPRPSDLLAFGQAIASTLPANLTVSEQILTLKGDSSFATDQADKEASDCVSNIILRNRCLQVLHALLFSNEKVNQSFSEDVVKVLGFDWVLLYMQGHLHSSTVVWGLRIFVVLSTCPNLLQRFRSGTGDGGWLKETEMLYNSMGSVLGYQFGTPLHKPASKALDSCAIPGFYRLAWLMPQHIAIPEVYFLLVALLLGQPLKLLPADSTLDIESIWNFLFGVSSSDPCVFKLTGRLMLCSEALIVLLGMVRTMLNQEGKSPDSLPAWLKDYPVTIIQVLNYLYKNIASFMPIVMSSEVLSALVSTLFPKSASEASSGASTPGDEVKTFMNTEPAVMIQSPSKELGLTNHPAKKFVMEFLKVIIVDSFSLCMSSKGPPVIDLVLEASPDNCSVSQQSVFQTEILAMLMEHLLASDLSFREYYTFPAVPGGCTDNISPNAYYFAGRLVDKLWQGVFTKDPHEVFDFVTKLIIESKSRPSSLAHVSLEGVYHCLNRTILYLLSRPCNSVADQMMVLEALHKITNYRGLIFGAGNHELEFIGCLAFCLLQLTAAHSIPTDTSCKTTWHVPELTVRPNEEGHNLMVIAAKRVWDELYICKKPAIEEVFKTTLTSPNNMAPSLVVVRDQVFDTAHRLWTTYVETERKSLYRIPWELHSQIQSKIQRVTGGLTRLASRTKVRREEAIKVRPTTAVMSELATQIQSQVTLVCELVSAQLRQHLQNTHHMQQYLLDEWLQTEAELTRECGLWGPRIPSKLDKWMLDMTEGPCRMRKKLMKNNMFYVHYPFRPEMETGDARLIKYKVATSFDSKEYYLRYRPQSMFERERDTIYDVLPCEEITCDPSVDIDESRDIGFHGLHVRPGVSRSISEPDDEIGEGEGDASEESQPPDNHTLLRLLEDKEKIHHMFRTARIQGLDTTEGLLLFGKEHVYVIDGFTILKSREICDIENLPLNQYEPILPSPSSSPRRSRSLRQCSKFLYEDIREVHKRRYLLQPIALEVFSGDGRNYLLAFPRKMRQIVYQRFMTYATSIADSAQQSVAGQKRTASVEQGANLFSNFIGEPSVTQRWVRGEISNFQYLMHLNTLAGRSYNDLMQYPVFPWILADYDSEELDLTNPKSFRDFSKPMGAQSTDRLEQFKKRFREWDDPHGETPPYHYGTHYSSAMIVCSYLVRMEPFTQHFLRLQGGHFDLADRMFHSIREAWLSASKHNMADVKELIPEFFYLPEFLVNSNNFDLGVKQNGVQLGDVILPGWAKNDTLEFIRMHRQALECDYVSAHLHEWLDLVFGCKQQGAPAVEATNVFHHLFYEGNVDIYNIDDPLKKNATIGFINNFGQIPKQLFKKPHPAKKIGSRPSMFDPAILSFNLSVSSGLFFHSLDNLRPSLQSIKELKAAVGQILHHEKTVLAVEQNKTLVPPNYNKYVAWGFADHSLRIGNYESDKAALVCEALQNGEVIACVSPSSKMVITAGTSTIVTVWELHKKQLKVKQNLYGHTDAVTCLAASPAYNVIISGSRDTSAIVWDLSRLVFVRQLRGHAAPLAAVAVNEVTGDIATCAGTWLHVWTINGDELASVNTCVGRADRMQQILCVAFSQANEWDPQNVVMTGSTDGVARMWSLDYVQVPKEDQSSTEMSQSIEHTNKTPSKTDDDSNAPATEVPLEGEIRKVKDLVKQMSMSGEYTAESGVLLVKSASASSLSEEEEEKEGSPTPGHECVYKDVSITEETKVPSIDVEDYEKPVWSSSMDDSSPVLVVRRRTSTCHNPEFRKSEGSRLVGLVDEASIASSAPCSTLPCQSDTLRTSKSDTSLTDSFVIVGENEASEQKKKKNPQNVLREGFKWQRQLVFRSKLTMHTAYDRKDNAEPASITCLAVSKDHRTMYVGDARGRVFSWSVAEQPGRAVADHWHKDECAQSCVGCGVRFNLYERRHHCRNCGQLFCSRCSRFESEISRLRILNPVRVCQGCYAVLNSAASNS